MIPPPVIEFDPNALFDMRDEWRDAAFDRWQCLLCYSLDFTVLDETCDSCNEGKKLGQQDDDKDGWV